MTLRTRLMVVAGAAVAVAVALASVTSYFLVRHQLRTQVDRGLRDRVEELARRPILRRIPPPFLGGSTDYVQIVFADGSVRRQPGAAVELRVDERAVAVARGDRGSFYDDGRFEGTDVHVRVFTAPGGLGSAIQIARSVDDEDRTLRRLRLLLLVLSGGGILVAALLGRGVAEAALGPVEDLTETVEHVTATRDLSRRIDVRSKDELGRLAARFNEMLGALETSLTAQQQLVADASHELRTPLTSLRTNIEVLSREGELTGADRGRLRADVQAQLEELSVLVADLIELARGGDAEAQPEDVRLDELVARAVARARTHAPHVRFETALEPTTVRGVAARLDRAVANLLDNAAKWSPAGGVVEVSVAGGEVTDRDHGPGIDAADLPHVFDRFYRAPSARGLPGIGAWPGDRRPGRRGPRRHGLRRVSERRRRTPSPEVTRAVSDSQAPLRFGCSDMSRTHIDREGTMRWKWLITALALVALAGAGAGFAASRGGSGSTAAPAAEPFLTAVAKRVGVEPENLLAAMKAEAKERLQAAVADGRLPAAVAARVEGRIDAATLERPLGLLGPGPRGGGPPQRLRVRREAGTAAAAYLGLSRAELRAQLRQGKSLAQIAKEQGRSVDGLKAAILAEARARLDEAVANGRLTRAQADELYGRLRQRLDDVVERTPPALPAFGALHP